MAESSSEKKVHGIVAEFSSVDALLAACRRVRDAGYEKTDAFTPFPVHGIDEALGIKPTVLPWIALGGGLSGTVIAFAMQIWMNGIDYQYIISGKPFISLPAFTPIAFELTILLASFGAFFGMWALNKLPRFSNPLFTSPRFDRVTDDGFFLYIESKDERYDESGVRRLLADCGGEHVEPVVEDDSPTMIPRFLLIGLVTIIAVSLIPALIVAKMRVTTSSEPRLHVFYDMDFSPSKGAQQTSSLFTDLRAARSDVPGTVTRGDLGEDIDVLTGIDVDELARRDPRRADRLVAVVQAPQDAAAEETPRVEVDDPATKNDSAVDGQPAEGDDAAGEPPSTSEGDQEAGEAEPAASDAGEAAAGSAQTEDDTPWLTEIPSEVGVDRETYATGRRMFEIYCAVCHGPTGKGNGLATQRAQRILATTWTPPSNINDPSLHREAYPDGKLFSTISNGIRKMPGYASQIEVRDRWAIVAYVRALQLSQNATLEMVPEARRGEISEKKAQIEAELAEAERQRQEEAAEAGES